ncbi:serine/threonine protein kinase [Flavobacterium album]|uniref:Serine/threonine protein kinase n=1 Tax=Flavobacterium album TaxID=2175091 RepID=A0A2S1QXE3_9FLAO|nr:YARHG domain-containing protein [Flavobacterium album]AWH85068.1 serine/threonine protein kinase [Flavobacterium album]
MKKLILFISLFGMACSCKNEEGNKKNIAENDRHPKYSEYCGIWSGDIEPVYAEDDTISVPVKKITIKISSIIGDKVYGQSLVAGVQRPLTGKISEKENDVIMLTLDEPGTLAYDGRYELEMIKGSFLEGTHTAFKDSPDTTTIKKLRITHRQFVYNPNFMLSENVDRVDWENSKQQEVEYDEYYDEGEAGEDESDSLKNMNPENDTLEDGVKQVYLEDVYRVASKEIFSINASVRKLSEAELKNLTKLDLEIIRNTIFARHGYSFRKNSIRHFFEVNYWYVPISNNVDKELTALEKENIALLSRFEKYAEDYYDSFGR